MLPFTENIKEFLRHFQLYLNYPPGNNIKKVISQLIQRISDDGIEVQKQVVEAFELQRLCNLRLAPNCGRILEEGNK